MSCFEKKATFLILDSTDNQLTYLNAQNGNNTMVSSFGARFTPDLSCIQVDGPEWPDAKSMPGLLEFIWNFEVSRSVDFSYNSNWIELLFIRSRSSLYRRFGKIL